MNIQIDVRVHETGAWSGPEGRAAVSVDMEADPKSLPWEAICDRLVQAAILKFEAERDAPEQEPQ